LNGWAKKISKKFLTTDPKPVILIPMMNDLSDMIQVSIEETITPEEEARMEFERGEHESERAERWAAVEAEHGPLHGPLWWAAGLEGMAWKD